MTVAWASAPSDPPSHQRARWASLVAVGLAAPASVLCALAWRLSFSWPLLHDLPIMLYLSLLWDRFGRVPHAGFFDMNWLGSYVAYLAIGRLFGYDALAVRRADLCVYLLIAALTIFALRRLGWGVGWLAAALFGLLYLQLGPAMSLQREYLMLVPLSGAVAAATSAGRGRWRLAAALSGACVGVAMTIKPQALVAAPPLAAFLAPTAREGDSRGRLRAATRVSLWLGAGVLAVAVVFVASLAALGSLAAFWEIATRYLPLYGAMTGRHALVSFDERVGYSLAHLLRLGGHWEWVLAAGLGAGPLVAFRGRGDPRRRLALLLSGLVVAFALYVLATGKFWPYHWLPMLYFAVLCAACAPAALAAHRGLWVARAATAVLGVLLVREFAPHEHFGGLLERRVYGETTASQIAAVLEARLRPGDTVQPLDWTKGGVLHALLIARAPAATSFVYDFHFHHHVSHPYIQALRERFLAELREEAPRFVVRSHAGPVPMGDDTRRGFPALSRLLEERYRKVAASPAYAIYELREDAAPDPE